MMVQHGESGDPPVTTPSGLPIRIPSARAGTDAAPVRPRRAPSTIPQLRASGAFRRTPGPVGDPPPAATADPPPAATADPPERRPELPRGSGARRSRLLLAGVACFAALVAVAGLLSVDRDGSDADARTAPPAVAEPAGAPASAPVSVVPTSAAPGTSGTAPAGVPTGATQGAVAVGDMLATGPVVASAGAQASGRPAPRSARAVPSPSRRPDRSAAPAAPLNTAGTNLAAGRPVTASGSEGVAWQPSMAVDGDLGTRWSSAFSDPGWIAVDLGQPWRLREIRVRWEHAHATAYRIEVSVDGVAWRPVYRTTTGSGGDVIVPVGRVAARHVRMYGTQRSGRYGYSLLELEVR